MIRLLTRTTACRPSSQLPLSLLTVIVESPSSSLLLRRVNHSSSSLSHSYYNYHSRCNYSSTPSRTANSSIKKPHPTVSTTVASSFSGKVEPPSWSRSMTTTPPKEMSQGGHEGVEETLKGKPSSPTATRVPAAPEAPSVSGSEESKSKMAEKMSEKSTVPKGPLAAGTAAAGRAAHQAAAATVPTGTAKESKAGDTSKVCWSTVESRASIGEEGIKTTGAHESIWQRISPMAPAFPPLSLDIKDKPIHTDTVIIGAGIAGLTTAYKLIRAGRDVIIIDARQVGGGETGRTSAHLAYYMDDTIEDLMKKHGAQRTKLIVESHSDAIDVIETIVKRHNIDCDFERVNGFLIQSKKSVESEKSIIREWDHILKCEVYPEAKLISSAGPIEASDSGKAIWFPNQAQFNPTKYLYALARIISDPNNEEIRIGVPDPNQFIGQCNIYCGTHIVKYQGGANTYVESTEGHKVHARNIVMATNVPLNLITMIDSVAPMHTYCITAPIDKSYRLKHGASLFWDEMDPYHYVRLVPGDVDKGESDMLLIGGEDHVVGRDEGISPDKRYQKLEAWAREKWNFGSVVDRWSGQVEEPMDDIAYIGRNPHDHDNVYIVTGDSGQGLTHGTIAGVILSGLITKKLPSRYEEVYNPSRMRLRAAPEYLAHNTATQFQFARWLAPLSGDIEDLPVCSGAVMRDGLTPVAVYKDKDGKVQKCSAVCTHMKGIVRWNNDEKTWDCPVHGSRFSPQGEVLHGPAKDPLPPVKA